MATLHDCNTNSTSLRRGEGRRPRAVQGERSVARRLRPQRAEARRAGNARPHGAAQAVRREEAAGRRAHHGQPAHDDSDRRAHRDARPSSAPTCAGCRATSSRRRITRPPLSSWAVPRRAAPRRIRRAFRCSRGKAKRSRSTGGAPSRRWNGRTAAARR